MPGMDGGVLADELEKNPQTKDIPYIFLSCLASGAKDKSRYVAKPFKDEDLLQAIGNNLK